MSKQYCLYSFILFVMSSKGAKIDHRKDIFVNFYPVITNTKLIEFNYVENRPFKERFINHLKPMSNHININYDSDKILTICDVHFRSIFGKILQKLQCTKSLKHNNKKQSVGRTNKRMRQYLNTENNERPMYPQNNSNSVRKSTHSLEDLAKDNSVIQFADDYLDVRDLMRSKDCSQSLRRKLPADYFDLFENLKKENTHATKKCPLASRKSEMTVINSSVPKDNQIIKTMTNESSDSTDDSIEIEKI